MEQIYTIPINEAFEKCAEDESLGCPFCAIRRDFETTELDLILGASMMDPDVRIKTNDLGFCTDHFHKMLSAGKKLPLALILESHLERVSDNMKIGRILPGVRARSTADKLGRLDNTCYICDRIENNFDHMMNNAVYLYDTDPDFRVKCSKQHSFCFPHYAMFLKYAKEGLKQPVFNEFYKSVSVIEEKYMKKLRENVSFFAKKFDYRYENEPWGDAKDAIEQALKALTGEDFHS